MELLNQLERKIVNEYWAQPNEILLKEFIEYARSEMKYVTLFTTGEAQLSSFLKNFIEQNGEKGSQKDLEWLSEQIKILSTVPGKLPSLKL